MGLKTTYAVGGSRDGDAATQDPVEDTHHYHHDDPKKDEKKDDKKQQWMNTSWTII